MEAGLKIDELLDVTTQKSTLMPTKELHLQEHLIKIHVPYYIDFIEEILKFPYD